MPGPWEQYQEKKPWETYGAQPTQAVEPVVEEEKLKEEIYASDVPTLGPTGEIIKRPPKPEPTLEEKAIGVGEAALATVTGATGGAIGMGAGLVKQLGEEVASGEYGTAKSAERVEEEAFRMAGEYTYQPRGEVGQAYAKKVGDTLGQILPPAMPFVAGLDGAFIGLSLRNLRSGTKLITSKGKPTDALRKALDKNGLVYENLSAEAKSAIPKNVTPDFLGTAKSEIAKVNEKALVEQIKSGARDDALAPLKVVGNKIKPDALGLEAMAQGFEPSFVQAVKTSTPETRAAMGDMLTIMNRITKNRKVALETRPTDVVGKEVMKRVSFIKNKAKSARLELDTIANTELKGMALPDKSIDNITNRLSESLDKIDVKIDDSITGVPKPNFEGSMISKDRTSQRVIKDLIDLMGEGGRPDALRMHKMKRQLDTMIDFRKKSVGGLTEAGKTVLKDIRHELNQTLRDANPKYAATNDILSSSIGSIDGFKKAIGPSIDIFAEGSEKAIGTDLKGLLGNRKTRIKLDNSLNQLDDVAKELGGSFKVNYKDLADFANGVEDRFGTVAKASFKGEIESAIKTTQSATERGAAATLGKAAFDKAADMASKMRGKNDFNAFKSMRNLIRGEQTY